MRRDRRSVAALALAGTLALAACGDTDDEPVATDAVATPATEAPPATEAEPTASDPEAPTTDAAPEPTTAEPESEPEPESETEPEPEPEPEPVEEEATVAPAQLGGRQLGESLRAESDLDTNPLPDLLVDDVRAGAKVNVRNILPADRPVLLWAWAPH